ncbi:MAG: hypothetical protein WEC75_04155 [Dehalococcoidia bacterium]
MVASRKPKTAAKRRHKRETLEEKFQRILSEPVGTPTKLTKREALYILRRVWETGDPASSPPGDEVIKRFYGLWPEPDDDHYPE